MLYAHGKYVVDCSEDQNDRTWLVTDAWLKGKELVSRLASNGKITREHGVMVGTTTGRVVELGLGSSGDRLVPSAAVTDSIAQSLHVENGILMMLEGAKGDLLRTHRVTDGHQIGIWTLPDGQLWVGLCSTGSIILALSASDGGQLWAFHTPTLLVDEEMAQQARSKQAT